MQLLELTPDEIAFLTTSRPAVDGFQTRLGQKLATTLTARLRMPVQVTLQPSAASGFTSVAPNWQVDSVLTTLWLTRRLGGQRPSGVASFVPPTLIHALDAALAECWLDSRTHAAMPPFLAWQITSTLSAATLGVQLPHHTTEMTRWAREVIRHV